MTLQEAGLGPRSAVRERNKRSGQRALALFLGYLVLDIGIFSLLKHKSSFWGTDVSLFLRYANDPAFFHYTSPAIAQAIEGSPSLTREIAGALHSLGFTYRENFKAVYLLLVSAATAMTLFALYNAIRGLGTARESAFLITLVMVNAYFVVSYSRLHPLDTVMKDGGFSMLAAAGFLLSIGLLVRGWYRTASLCAAVAGLIHPIFGMLGAGSVLVIAVFERKLLGIRVLDGKVLGVAFVLAALSTFYLLRYAGGVVDAAVPSDLFFDYVKFRSSNPMPLRDGIASVLTHVVVLVCTLTLVHHVQFERRSRWVITALCFLWATWWGLQVVFTEIMQAPALAQLVLHRSTPMIFLVFGAVLGVSLYRRSRTVPLAVYLVLSALVILHISSRDAVSAVSPFGVNYLNVSFWASIFTSFCIVGLRVRMVFVVGMASLLAIQVIAIAYAGTPASQLFNDKAVPYLSLIVFAAIVLSKPRIWEHMRSLRWLGRFSLSQWLIGAILLVAGAKVVVVAVVAASLDRDVIQLYSRYYAMQLLEQSTGKRDVVYVVDGTDINGIRRPFMDWKYDWYSLYSVAEIPKIVEKLAAIGIDIRSDELAREQCQPWAWVVVPRCHRVRGKIDARLRDFNWRQNWETLRRIEPRLTVALVPNDRVRGSDRVLASSGRYSVVAP